MNFKKNFVFLLCMAFVSLGLPAYGEIKNTPLISKSGKPITTPFISFKSGKVVKNEYINKSLGFKFVLPKEYRFLTNEEIALITNIAADEAITDKKAQAELKKQKDFVEMVAVITNDTNNNVHVLVRNLSDNVDVEPLITILSQELNEQLQNSFDNFVVTQDGKQNLAGMEFYVLSMDWIMNGEKYHQKKFIQSWNKKIVFISFTYDTDDELKKMINAFHKIK